MSIEPTAQTGKARRQADRTFRWSVLIWIIAMVICIVSFP